jgi:hypothetical protein
MAVVQLADIIQAEYLVEYKPDPDDALFPAIVEILSTPLRPDRSNVPPAAPCESADYS